MIWTLERRPELLLCDPERLVALLPLRKFKNITGFTCHIDRGVQRVSPRGRLIGRTCDVRRAGT